MWLDLENSSCECQRRGSKHPATPSFVPACTVCTWFLPSPLIAATTLTPFFFPRRASVWPTSDPWEWTKTECSLETWFSYTLEWRLPQAYSVLCAHRSVLHLWIFLLYSPYTTQSRVQLVGSGSKETTQSSTTCSLIHRKLYKNTCIIRGCHYFRFLAGGNPPTSASPLILDCTYWNNFLSALLCGFWS